MYGGMLLKTSMSLSESLSKLTMMLNRRPDLARRLQSGGDEDSRKSVAEASAEIIQKIFTTCLTDRQSGRYSAPEGKKIGVYMFANLVLKLLFAVSFFFCFFLPRRSTPNSLFISVILHTIYLYRLTNRGSVEEVTLLSRSLPISPQTLRPCHSIQLHNV
jgi:hypothetical protein